MTQELDDLETLQWEEEPTSLEDAHQRKLALVAKIHCGQHS